MSRPSVRPSGLLGPLFVDITLVCSLRSKFDPLKIRVPRTWPLKNEGFRAPYCTKPSKNNSLGAPDFTKSVHIPVSQSCLSVPVLSVPVSPACPCPVSLSLCLRKLWEPPCPVSGNWTLGTWHWILGNGHWEL